MDAELRDPAGVGCLYDVERELQLGKWDLGKGCGRQSAQSILGWLWEQGNPTATTCQTLSWL